MSENLDQRTEPSRLFPWARNVVVFSLKQPAAFGSDTGEFRIAAYALGEDYHQRARRTLGALESQLRKKHPADPFQFHGFCDTWPIFERDIAAEAGLGWRGKNTCLIHKKHGSGFLLAGFFTDLELSSPQGPAEDFCGGCTACLQACPTGALLEPGKLDAKLCISYWTIESKTEIPGKLSGQFGAWIFGCDICQEACPWNHKHQDPQGKSPENWPRSAKEWLDLLQPGGGFQSRFKGTPLSRAGRKAMHRNIQISRANAETT